MGRKGVISSRATVYSKTERKRATQIAARSTAPFSWETLPHPPPPPLSRTLGERTVSSSFWSICKGGSWGLLYETQPWSFTLFSIKLHQEKWKLTVALLIFSWASLGWPIRSYNKHWNIFFDILKHWKRLGLEQRYFIQASSSNIGAISKKSRLLDSLLRNNTPR